MITLARWTLILLAIVSYLPWQLWMWIGGVMDKRGQKICFTAPERNRSVITDRR